MFFLTSDAWDHELLVSALTDLGARTALDHILISEAEGVEKPDAQLFLHACSKAGVQPAEALHVGDELEACVVFLIPNFLPVLSCLVLRNC